MRALAFSATLFGLTGLIVYLTGLAAPANLAFRPAGPAADAPDRPPCGAHAPAVQKGPKASLVNRVWVDRVPKDAKDLTFHLVLVDKAKQRVGVAAHTSAWRFHVDRLRFALDGAKLTLESPQTGTKATFKTRTFDCKGKAPAPYDLCLELKRGRRSVILYSARASRFGAQTELGLYGRALENVDLPACGDGCRDVAPAWFLARAN